MNTDNQKSKLKLYECRRYQEHGLCESWLGALIIYAESEGEAELIFLQNENETPELIVEIELCKGVIYNDECR